jgi:Undecaprenyl-phosphate galactose phosphotransferase WbaP
MDERLASAGVGEGGIFAADIRPVRYIRRVICASSLLAADMAAFATAIMLFRAGGGIPQIAFYRSLLPVNFVLDLFLVFGGLFFVIRYIAGDYTKRQLFWDSARLTTGTLLIFACLAFLIWFFSPVHYSVFSDVFSWSCVIVAVPAYRQAVRYVLSRLSLWQYPTALIGDGTSAENIYKLFRDSLSLGFDVRFQIAMGKSPETPPAAGVTRIDLKEPGNIVRRLSEAGCMQAVVVTDEMADDSVNELIERLLAAGMDIAVIPQIRRLPMLGLTINYFFGKDIILLHVRNNTGRLPGRIVKRTIDLVGSVFLLLALAPLLAVIAAMIRMDDGGKIFFVQQRVGRGGREFPCIKFRTMRSNAEAQLKLWKKQGSPLYRQYVASNFKLPEDPRITRIGRALRRLSLDELPQLFNVLTGDMSLVGPRPLLSREIGDYGITFKLYQQLRPGITGLWQISGRSRTTFSERAAADEWYVKNWSLWYDVVILIKTADVLIRRDGAY